LLQALLGPPAIFLGPGQFGQAQALGFNFFEELFTTLLGSTHGPSAAGGGGDPGLNCNGPRCEKQGPGFCRAGGRQPPVGRQVTHPRILLPTHLQTPRACCTITPNSGFPNQPPVPAVSPGRKVVGLNPAGVHPENLPEREYVPGLRPKRLVLEEN